jgi:hypothetical protein
MRIMFCPEAKLFPALLAVGRHRQSLHLLTLSSSDRCITNSSKLSIGYNCQFVRLSTPDSISFKHSSVKTVDCPLVWYTVLWSSRRSTDRALRTA